MGCEMSWTDFGTLKSSLKNCHSGISFACLLQDWGLFFESCEGGLPEW